jgi:epoxyqueuosine reductase
MSAADAREILDIAHASGFAFAAITDARPSDHADALRAWCRDGKHGSMAWLADQIDVRIDPTRLLRGARSVLCVADRYARPARDARTAEWPPRGRIARYARGQDYHTFMRKRLRKLAARLREGFPSAGFRFACDLLPILERELAARSGLGAIGKNTLVIRPGEGSYLVLGEVLMTLEVPSERSARIDPCGSCTRCIDACPTAAITPYSVDASRCLAYTTIEHRGAIPEEFWEATEDWIFGCDICQEVCPHNQPTRRKRRSPIDPAYEVRVSGFDLLSVLGWTEADRMQATMRSAIRRAELGMLKRNALICLGNSLRTPRAPTERTPIVARIAEVAADEREEAMVRETARRVLHRIGEGA